MANAEDIFDGCKLDLVVPDAVVDLPKVEETADSWLHRLAGCGERKKAFFDERLELFLLLRFGETSRAKPSDSQKPPAILLAFLLHLQVSLEATYISPTPQEPVGNGNGHLPVVPVRTSSALTAKPKNLSAPLPVLPPQTPSPLPATNEDDRKYIYSEGTLLKTSEWGDDPSDPEDAFRLLWSGQDERWVAVYKLWLNVAFVRTNAADPLLCLTTSITLRDKALTATPQRRDLLKLVEACKPLPSLTDEPEKPSAAGAAQGKARLKTDSAMSHLDEVNLLDGLSLGFKGSDKLYLPSRRVGPSLRQAYALPPITPASAKAPPTPVRSLPVLRKAFRRTLTTVSGFRVRMRTVFVPHVHEPGGSVEKLFGQEPASEECTVVLCVEIENSGESGAGYSVEALHVSVSGDGARISLIGWGNPGFADSSKVFPLFIRSSEQYNLLYSVSFILPADPSPGSAASDVHASIEWQRAVSINVIGRPFFIDGEEFAPITVPDGLSFPTPSFLSRWNCVLDLSPRRDRDSLSMLDSEPQARNILPFPVSPFPPRSPRTLGAQDKASQQPAAIAGPKRHTFAGLSASNVRAATPVLPSASSTPIQGKNTPIAKFGKFWRSGTPTAGPAALSPPLPALPSAQSMASQSSVPQTPAYPSYRSSDAFAQRPAFAVPSVGQLSSMTAGVDARREKMYKPGIPQTPAPRLMAGQLANKPSHAHSESDFIVSVSLVPPSQKDGDSPSPCPLYPLDEFSLEIFVFNQSPYVRTLEISYPDKRRRRDDHQNSLASSKADMWKPPPPAFMPLENRIVVGPLASYTCQSVQMRFLAMLPGVHTIDGLTLNDVDTGALVSLRSAMDFAVLTRNSG